MEGDTISASRINITPERIQAEVVMIRLVLIIFPLSSELKKRITDESNPSLEKRITRPIDEIRAVASPNCSTEYNRAAIIQKKKPQPALKMLVKAMKKEFLYKGSLVKPAIARNF